MVRCIVKNCKNTNTTCTPEEVSFHKIPENQIMREGWYKNIGEVVLPSNTVNARICSMHFTPESFVQPKRKRAAAEKISKRRSLLPSAIPTLNLLPLNEQASREENNMKVIRREFHLVCPSTSTNTPIRSSTPVPSPAGVTEHSQDLDLLLIDSTSCHETLTSVSTTNRCQEPTNSDNDVQKVSYELSRSDSFPTRSKKKKVVLHKCSTLSLHRTVRSRSKRFTSKTKVHEAEYNSEQGSPPLKRQCRYDYFERNLTPFMSHLKVEGTYTDYIMNIFVTKTFPNHHTMATGFYAETHGVIDNEFFDPRKDNITKYSYELYHYNNNIQPIWTVNEKSGRRSGTMMWPGSVFEYQGTSPTFAQAFNDTISWEKRVDELLSWFVHPTNPINLGILYIEDPDYHGHVIGINSPEFNEILRKLDNITKYMHDKIDHYGLTDDLNVIHLSDHGMASVTMERIINLTNYINASDYTFVGTSPGLHIFPHPGKKEMIYQKLKSAAEQTKTFKVYKREDIPKKYHYGDNIRVGPIFVIAEVGYAFQNLYDTIEYYKRKFNIIVNNQTEFGLHGYNNEAKEMHPFFFANGPAFMPKCKLEPFNNTDLFPLFCEILNLKCPIVNGTLSHITKCLRTQSKDISISTYKMFIAVIITTMLIGISVVATIIYRKKRRLAYNYRESYSTLGE